MSFLTPLYALGLLAIAAPVVFHLIRRTPRGEVPFSTLMFLAPSPPRLTRRSRLDQWLLLLLRASALALLAIAFARPFLRQAARLEPSGVDRQRVAVLIDASASMRRGDLWPRARAIASSVIDGCRPSDQVALFAFDDASRPLLGFAESAELGPVRRRAVARARLDGLAPGWGSTHLGQALIDAAGAIEDVADDGERAGRMPRRVVLIGDLQQGGRLEALGSFEWPSDVTLELRTVTVTGPNAALQRLDDPAEDETAAHEDEAGARARADAGPQRRVRVTNDSGTRDRFALLWATDAAASPAERPIDVYVPPGESRVVRVPIPAPTPAAATAGSAPRKAPRLTLRGDVYGFDNTLHFAEERREESTVLFVGDDAEDDPEGLLYYLRRVFQDTPRQTVRVRAESPSANLASGPDGAPSLIVLAAETSAENARRLGDYARRGGILLVVVRAPGRAATLAEIAGVSPFEVAEASVDRDVLLGEIAFDHPLFAPLAGAQFNDFTKIHFWKYRRLDASALGDARVLARFEGGDPAVVEASIGEGRLLVLSSGWAPADSQLARSSKFVPLMGAMLAGLEPPGPDAASYLVHDPVPLPTSDDPSRRLVVRKPDGATVAIEPGEASFTGTDQPGVYTIEAADGSGAGTGTASRRAPRSFAVNLDPLESKTAPLQVETLEQFGCKMAGPSTRPPDPEQLRQMRNAELEGRQKLWRWLILAAIGVLIAETWLAGRAPRARPARAEALAS